MMPKGNTDMDRSNCSSSKCLNSLSVFSVFVSYLTKKEKGKKEKKKWCFTLCKGSHVCFCNQALRSPLSIEAHRQKPTSLKYVEDA